jgi:transcriptional regulator with XRE-family HTH domain
MDGQMKIDAGQVRRLREARAWSQEHLAAVAALSACTIQRVEAEGVASPETRLAIAAARRCRAGLG